MLKHIASLVALVALLLVPRIALAHQVGLSRGEYVRDERGVHVTIVFARGDAASLDLAPGTNLNDVVTVQAGGVSCGGRLESLEKTAADGLELRALYTCPESLSRSKTAIDAKLVDALGGGHRHLAHVDGKEIVLKERDSRFEIASGLSMIPKSSPSLFALIGMGIEHILTGWDHLAFLFGLLLLGGRMRSLGLTISAFTIAHSITLGIAAFGVWTPPASFVEPAIALSIAWVGVENVRALMAGHDARVAERRWRITFAFGLVHGFGFASALRDVGMTHADVPKTLLGFNLGVEMGQLAVVIPLALGLAWIARSGKLPARATSLASACIVMLGVALFVARVA